MKFDNSCDIDNLAFLLYMQEQEEKAKKKENREQYIEKEKTNK